MSINTKINCPDCNTPIPIESSLLLAGHSFKCTNSGCSTAISLSFSESEKVAEAYKKMQGLREAAIDQAGYSTIN